MALSLARWLLWGGVLTWLASTSEQVRAETAVPAESPAATASETSGPGATPVPPSDQGGSVAQAAPAATERQSPTRVQPGKVPEFVVRGVEWLVKAQHSDGGWGGGSHAHQEQRDPHAVVTDPATTAFTLLALLRAGHTPAGGAYQEQALRGLEYLVGAVEQSPADGALITQVSGTQPQTKLGPYVDTSMTAQYLARALPLLADRPELKRRTEQALNKCLRKLQVSQQADGSWGGEGAWAPVLQSSLACSALEIAAAGGAAIDQEALVKARSYQQSNADASTGRAKADAAAGVELYAFSGAFRANAAQARRAQTIVDEAKASGKLALDAVVSEENLVAAGAVPAAEASQLAQAASQNEAQIGRLGDEQLLSGFGSNGGEEFLSYLMTSETLLIAGADQFLPWQDKMQGRLAKIQNGDGSWSGHHCITSPVFCTAAVVQCLTADQDVEFLSAMAERTASVKTEAAGAPAPTPAPKSEQAP